MQGLGDGCLICEVAQDAFGSSTNEVNPEICLNCDAGKIYREIGCDKISPKTNILNGLRGRKQLIMLNLFCPVRKRDTTLEYCRSCNLVKAETTMQMNNQIKSIFSLHGFDSAYKDLIKANESFRDGNFDNVVTRSIAFLESTMKICHEKLEEPLPNKKTVTDLWKSTRNILKFNDLDESGSSSNLLNALTGVVVQLGGLRNSLSDAHGRGMYSQDVSETIAELALNTSATLSTIIVRRYNQLKIE